MNDPKNSKDFQKYTAITAEEYAAFRERILANERTLHRPGIALQESSAQCKAIEVMCSGLSIAILEIFAGRRPANHIAKWLSKDCYEKVTARARITKETLRRTYASVPLNQSPFGKKIVMPKTRRVKAQQINEDVFEVTLILEDFARVRAMAIRVERVFNVWKITAIEIA